MNLCYKTHPNTPCRLRGLTAFPNNPKIAAYSKFPQVMFVPLKSLARAGLLSFYFPKPKQPNKE
jgi:hypothetical protein